MSSFLRTHHPARFPAKLPEFFIRMLTEPNDLVLDIFSGSNTTGQVAEDEGRRWISIDENNDYVAASAFRFIDESFDKEQIEDIYCRIKSGESLRIPQGTVQELLMVMEG